MLPECPLMTSSKRIAKNTFVILVSEAISLLLSFIFIAVLAQYLGVKHYGIYTFAFAFVALFKTFFDFGLNTLIVRETARNQINTQYYLANAFAIEVLFSVFFVVAIPLIAYLIGYPLETVFIVCIAAAIAAIDTFSGLNYAFFKAYEIREYEAYTKIAGKLVFITLGFVSIYLGFDLPQIVTLFIISSVISFLLSYGFIHAHICPLTLNVRPRHWISLMKLAFPFALSILLIEIYFNIDMTMLSYLQGDEPVGLYSVAYRFITIFLIIPAAFTLSIFPVYSRLFEHAGDGLHIAFHKSVEYLLVLSIPISIGITIIADNIILAFFGEMYSDSIIALQILIWVIAFLFVNYTCNSILQSILKPNLCISSLIISAIFNIALNALLIPVYSYKGAAFATVATEILLLSLYTYHLKNNGIRFNFFKFISTPVIAGLFMALSIYVVKSLMAAYPDILQMLIVIPLGMLVYVLSLIKIRKFDRDDLAIFRGILGDETYNKISFLFKRQE